MGRPSFSVIVPVYKTEAYLGRCVDSILNQSFSDFELILVDDDSPDNSGAICDEYAKRNSKVKVIHRPNGGLCSARNTGLQAAQGEFITFCDSDDYWASSYLEKLGYLIRQENVGLAICGFQSVSDDGRPCSGRCSGERQETMGRQILHHDLFWSLFRDRRIGSCWDKAYRAEIIKADSIRFDSKITLVEDTDFVLRYLAALSSKCCLAVTDDKLYMYQTTEHESLVHKFNPEQWQMFEHLFRQLEDYISTDADRISFYSYVCSAITYTLDNLFRYKPGISLGEFSEIVNDMLRSDYYKNAFTLYSDIWSGHKRLFTKTLQSGSAALIWGYYMISNLKKSFLSH